MNILRWLVALTALAVIGFTGGPVFAQSAEIDETSSRLANDPGNQELRVRLVNLYYKQALEDLQNNLDADAVGTLNKGLETASGGTNPVSDSHESVAETRYALGYALARQGKYFDAVLVIDDLVAAQQENFTARYLLGVTLIRSNTNENIQRGMEVLKQIAAESPGTNETASRTASARLTYNISTTEYAGGNAKGAADMMSDLFAKHGDTPGANDAENQHLKFASGVYLAATGDSSGAQFQLDGLAQEASGYALNNGTTLDQVRSNVHYQAALDALSSGGSSGGATALDAIRQVEDIDGSSVTTMHVKALAYSLTGDSEAMNNEMDAIKSADQSYYDNIKQ